MDYSKGFTASYDLTIVDPVSWRDLSHHRLTGGTIERNTDLLMESADLDLTELPGDGEVWIRVWLTARQEYSGEVRIPLFTGLTTVPQRKLTGKRESYPVSCYSVLKPAADCLLPRGWYAPKNGNGAKIIEDLLSVGSAPVSSTENSPVLSSAIVSEDGETNLSMASKVLTAIGWRLRISGNGEINIQPESTEVAATFDAASFDILEPSVTDTCDWYSCPNVFRAVSGSDYAVARDEDTENRYSIPSRGREVWMEETDCTLKDGETLLSYAKRRLKEEQSPSRTISYDRRYVPDICPGDRVRLHYPEEKIDGIFEVQSQSITLGFAAKTSEEVIEV
jgi:hypothetical protein